MGGGCDRLLPRPRTGLGTRGSGQWDTWHVSVVMLSLSQPAASTLCGHNALELLLTARMRLLPVSPPGNNGPNIRPSEDSEARPRSIWWQPSTLSPELFHVSCPANKPIILEKKKRNLYHIHISTNIYFQEHNLSIGSFHVTYPSVSYHNILITG